MTTTTLQAEPVESAIGSEAAPVGFWEHVTFSIVHAATTALLWTTTLSGLYRFGQLFGTLEWLINYKRRRRFNGALKRVLGRRLTDADRRRWTRDHFVKTRCDKLFYLVFDRIPRERAMSLFTVENESALEAAFARGRGVYSAMSHHGSLHIVPLLLALRGYKIVGVRDRREGGLRRFVQRRLDLRYPEFQRMRVLYADSYPREIYRSLQDGYLVGSAMDVSRVRLPHQKTEEVTVFGETRAFLTGPLRIALRCGATVFQGFIRSDPGFRYHLEFIGPLVDPDTVQDEDAAVTAAMRTYAANVERFIRTTPSMMTRL